MQGTKKSFALLLSLVIGNEQQRELSCYITLVKLVESTLLLKIDALV